MDKCALVLCSKKGFGGAERRFLRIYNGIAKRKHGVCVIFQSSPQMDTLSLLRQMQIDTASFSSIQCCNTRRDIVRECLFGGYYSLHLIDASLLWMLLAILAKIRHIHVVNTIADFGLACRTVPIKFRFFSAVLWRFSNRVDLLYPQCRSIVERYCNKGSLTCTPGTFTDLQLFQPASKQKILLFSAARLDKWKNPGLMIEAISLIADKVRQAGYKAVITGRGYQEQELRARIREKSLEDIIHMPGYVSPQDYVPQAEVVLSLGQTACYPSQIIAEAAACGCAVIAKFFPDEPRNFLDKSFTLFCDMTPESLSQKILEYFEMPESKKQEMRCAARAHAEKFFRIDKSVNYFNAILDSLR